MAATRDEVRAWRAILALGVGLLCAGHAAAQGPRQSLVQQTARAWLAVTDRDDAAQSWESAGKQFRNAITTEQWARSLHKVRPPLGATMERALLSTKFRKSIPGAPDGDYALVVFRSRFANKALGEETVVLQLEADGAWRVIGYTIR
ncbi:MAG: DUF4019 domain-containing protein [Burkholderiales bacterium]|jgi:hypothetical protein